jgi:Domain of unknown function (DUF4129)
VTDAALRDLAARAAGGDGTAQRELTARARAQARDIVAQSRFHESHHHDGPLHGVFVTLGDWLESVIDALPGGEAGGWLLLAVCAAGVAGLVMTIERRRRRSRDWGDAVVGVAPAARAAGPDELERRAAEAERAGDLDTAIRLRFSAGLLRLDRAQAIELRPSLTSGEVGRTLRSPRYDTIARTHDAVAYGGRPADAHDAAEAREGWPAIVGEARRR